MLNEIILIGRLGKTPELKETTTGTKVTSFGLATSEKWKDQQGNKKEETQWHNLVVWGANAETVCKYMKKGELHLFKGTLKYEKDKDYDNNKKMYAKIHVTSFKFLPQAPAGGNGGGYTPSDPQAPGYTGGRSSDEPSDGGMPSMGSQTTYDDDIPF